MNPAVLSLLVFGVMVGGVLLAVQRYEKRRREAYAAYALMHGLTFTAACPGKEAGFSVIPMFDRGYRRTWRYEMRGSRGGVEFTAFEYVYVTGGGKSSQRHYQGVMLWRRPEGSWPNFVAAPESWFDRLLQKMGTQDFDFAEDAAFSNAYKLQGGDEAAVRAVFDSGKRAYLAGHPGQHVAGTGDTLMWWRPGRLPPPDQLDQFIADGDGVRRVFF
jgi:hypothetical protein